MNGNPEYLLRVRVTAAAGSSTDTVLVVLSTGFNFFCIQEGGASTSLSFTHGGRKDSRRGPLSLLTFPIGIVSWKEWFHETMARLFFIVFVCLLASVAALPSSLKTRSSYNYPFNFVARETWGARPPNGVTSLSLPVPYVVVHHSYIPPDCDTKDTCKRSMRLMQDMHQLHNGWQDIGYNFAVGGEGSVYEGRGWNVVGAHAVSYNVRSIGICMIGDFVENLPPATQIQSLKELIASGVELGYISPDYKLIGHRQVTATECPGQALFDEISTWDHFAPS